jgi:hypothetical protein
MRQVIAVLSFCVCVGPTFAQSLRVTGLVSNLHFVKEAGDIVGTEIFIMFSNEGLFALVQCAEGSPSAPVLVPVMASGAEISFKVPADSKSHCSGGEFNGRVTRASLQGQWTFGQSTKHEDARAAIGNDT